jgi:uncharacterized protein
MVPFMTSFYDKVGLIALLRKEFRLDWKGIHGAPHWARVLHHGRYLAGKSGADSQVIELFALLHDSQLENEWRDPGHGVRAAEFAASLNGKLFNLTDHQLEKLIAALSGHSDGDIADDVTIQTCWDADRLDLGRVGKVPEARFLSMHAAQRIDYACRLRMRFVRPTLKRVN